MMSESLYGLMAKFNSPEEVLAATRAARDEGYRAMEAYSPFPVEGLDELLDYKPTIQYWVLIGGIVGAITGFALQYYASVISYPIIIGGRPFNSWPAFIIIIFELTILFAGITAVFGTLGLSGFPMPYHSVFNVEDFRQVSRDKFFLCIESQDPKFDANRTRAFLESMNPEDVTEVKP
jgi:hypothetical protein